MALNIVDIWIVGILLLFSFRVASFELIGGAMPYFTVHPPLSTTTHAGKEVLFFIETRLILFVEGEEDAAVAAVLPAPFAGDFFLVGVAAGVVSDPMVPEL